MKYSVDAVVGLHILNLVKTDSLAHAYRALANAIDLVENDEAMQLIIFDEDNDYKILASVDKWDL